MKVKRTERGWPGHFCCARDCLFRRNTLLEYGEQRIIVSTVGDMRRTGCESQKIGSNRYYETMAFNASLQDGYLDMSGSELPFDSEWAIADCEQDADMRANDMHERVVAEFTKRLKSGTQNEPDAQA